MIARLTGTLAEKSVTGSTVDVAGVGYAVAHSLHTFEDLPALGERVELLTHLHVREDVLQLYGFSSALERRMFELLLSVSGVGPKVALAVLSGLTPDSLARAIREENLGALTRITGVGRKTAERIVIELRDRVAPSPAAGGAGGGAGASAARAGAQEAPSEGEAAATGRSGRARPRPGRTETLPGGTFDDAVAALTTLGLTRAGALENIQRALDQGPVTGVEDLVRRALAQTSQKPSGRPRAGVPGV